MNAIIYDHWPALRGTTYIFTIAHCDNKYVDSPHEGPVITDVFFDVNMRKLLNKDSCCG